jgi:cholestenol delta-isomerase
MEITAHPYFPLDLHLPDYVPLQVDFAYILGVFFSGVLAVFAATWFLSGMPLL